jgi:hypothetical protein
MAGNDGDLLKQATQRMMARYEGELGQLSLGVDTVDATQ